MYVTTFTSLFYSDFLIQTPNRFLDTGAPTCCRIVPSADDNEALQPKGKMTGKERTARKKSREGEREEKEEKGDE